MPLSTKQRLIVLLAIIKLAQNRAALLKGKLICGHHINALLGDLHEAIEMEIQNH